MSVALVIQLAKRMSPVILSPVACPAVQYFDTLPHKRHDFRGGKKVTENKMWYDSLYKFCLKNFSF